MKEVSKGSKNLCYHTVIIELDSTLPRRNSKKPHLHIDNSLSTPEVRLGELQRGAGPKFAKGHYLSVFVKSPYSKPAKDPKIAKRRLDETIEKYERLGHMVNNRRNEWSVYVIDLKQEHLDVKPKSGHVYKALHYTTQYPLSSSRLYRQLAGRLTRLAHKALLHIYMLLKVGFNLGC